MRAETLPRPIAADLLTLTKPRITLLVVLTTAAAYVVATDGALDWPRLVHTLVGTALVAAGSGALNQYVERELDRLMRRTADRPLPAGRLTPDVALAFGVLLAATGLLQLTLAVNPLTAAVGAATLLAYVFVYTPAKRWSALATIVGAFPGAAPPVMGWTAVTGRLELGAWLLFALLFLWQLPHFLAIAWMYRDDYRAAGMPVLTLGDPDGARTGRQALLYAAALLPVSLTPAAVGISGKIYLVGALACGLVFLAFAFRFARRVSKPTARQLLLASVVYLPAVLGAMVVDHHFRL
ncbi:MAG: heme o synthase [Thermoanaerobaculia bacterium]